MLLQVNKLFRTLLTVIAAVVITASAAAAEMVPLYYGEIKKGDIPARANSLGSYDVAIEEVVTALGLMRSPNKQGIVVTMGGVKMEFWGSSSVARSNGMMISMPSPVEVQNGHWWGNRDSVQNAVNYFYTGIGKDGAVRFGDPVPGSRTKPVIKAPEQVKKAEPVKAKPVVKEEKKKPASVPAVQKKETKQPEPEYQISAPAAPVQKINVKSSRRPIVVLDAGHGGKDPGAGANGVREKDVTLRAVKILKKKLEAMGFDVRPTRITDVYLKLGERTAFANDNNANVFVSLHCNAMPKGKRAAGLEFYIMALPSDKDAMRLAVYENKELTQDGNTGEAEKKSDRKTTLLLKILGDMQQNHKIDDSTQFAEALHKSARAGGINPRKVAQAPFFVLRGAGMPAVLIEMGYLTDKGDAAKLRSEAYLSKLCDSFAHGIAEYIKEHPVVTK